MLTLRTLTLRMLTLRMLTLRMLTLCTLMLCTQPLRAEQPQAASSPTEKSQATTAFTEPTCSTSGRGLLPEDELWIIQTRHLPRPAGRESFQPFIQRYDRQTGWRTTAQVELSALRKHTVVYVHGNRIAHGEAVRRGWEMYAALSREQHGRPLRMIIWSWPSDQIKGQLRDVRFKAELADEEGYYLATWLAEFPQSEGLGMVGYSYGARVMGSSLHLLGGGTLPGVPAIDESSLRDDPLSVRAALIAPAMDSDAFADGRAFSEATTRAEQVLVLFNPCDPILRYYRWLDRCRPADAMGSVGAVSAPDPHATFEQIDVAPMIGRSHDLNDYLNHPSLMASVRRALYRPYTAPEVPQGTVAETSVAGAALQR